MRKKNCATVIIFHIVNFFLALVATVVLLLFGEFSVLNSCVFIFSVFNIFVLILGRNLIVPKFPTLLTQSDTFGLISLVW